MAFCTEDQVRSANKKFADKDKILKTTILERISAAEKIVKVDLSSIVSSAEVEELSSNSDAINILATNKSVELTLVAYYGATRKVDEISDIAYFKKEYQTLLDKILDGKISLSTPTIDHSPKSYPALGSGSNKKFYVRKGIDSFTAEGETQYGNTIVDDSIKS
jgi:hypothetical protein